MTTIKYVGSINSIAAAFRCYRQRSELKEARQHDDVSSAGKQYHF